MASLEKLKTLFAKNLSFTPQERTILLFLCAAFIVGFVLKLYSNTQSNSLSRKEFDFSSLDREFYEKSSGENKAETIEKHAQLHPINNITEDQLIALPSIGNVLARRIIEFRAKHGPLNDVDDLHAVPGIGPSRIRIIKLFIESEYIK